MILPDVNVLVYAHWHDAPDHVRYRDWLERVLDSDQPYAMSDLVLSGVLRIVTNPRIFSPPSPLDSALAFIARVRDQPHCIRVSPGPRHWEIFMHLCHEVGARGNLVPDAFLAALAIESGSEWITTDRDFARFPGLRWHLPLA